MKFALALLSILAAIVASSAQTATDIDVLNFALNLECLEAEFYSWSAFGHGLNATLRGGGPAARGGKKAKLSPFAQKLAEDIATDEIAHVAFLRAALGSAAVPCPRINIGKAFSTLVDVALKTTLKKVPFSPYGSDALFYTGAFVFEDVGVTAYHGALGLLSTQQLLSYASGILGTEAYHAGAIRSRLMDIETEYVYPYKKTVKAIVDDISNVRAAVGGGNDGGLGNLVPSGADAITYSRTTSEVLAIVYLGSASTPGGFFPKGLNGAIH